MAAKTALITSAGHSFGQGGYAGYHRIQLPDMGTTPSHLDGGSGEDAADNFRKGILFFFGNCSI